jgi:hypothetical protein
MFRKLDIFASSGEGRGKDTLSVGEYRASNAEVKFVCSLVGVVDIMQYWQQRNITY